jgi:hypothetical protein
LIPPNACGCLAWCILSTRLALSSAVSVTDLVFVPIETSFAGMRKPGPMVELWLKSSSSSQKAVKWPTPRTGGGPEGSALVAFVN